MVPAAHGQWLLKNLPSAKIVLLPGFGHMGLFGSNRDEIMAEVK